MSRPDLTRHGLYSPAAVAVRVAADAQTEHGVIGPAVHGHVLNVHVVAFHERYRRQHQQRHQSHLSHPQRSQRRRGCHGARHRGHRAQKRHATSQSHGVASRLVTASHRGPGHLGAHEPRPSLRRWTVRAVRQLPAPVGRSARTLRRDASSAAAASSSRALGGRQRHLHCVVDGGTGAPRAASRVAGGEGVKEDPSRR